MPLPSESLINYPADFPIKIMGVRQDDFAQSVINIVLQFDPGFDAATLEMRPSSQGTYLGLTATVHVTCREQLDNLYCALTAHPLVKVVL